MCEGERALKLSTLAADEDGSKGKVVFGNVLIIKVKLLQGVNA